MACSPTLQMQAIFTGCRVSPTLAGHASSCTQVVGAQLALPVHMASLELMHILLQSTLPPGSTAPGPHSAQPGRGLKLSHRPPSTASVKAMVWRSSRPA